MEFIINTQKSYDIDNKRQFNTQKSYDIDNKRQFVWFDPIEMDKLTPSERQTVIRTYYDNTKNEEPIKAIKIVRLNCKFYCVPYIDRKEAGHLQEKNQKNPNAISSLEI